MSVTESVVQPYQASYLTFMYVTISVHHTRQQMILMFVHSPSQLTIVALSLLAQPGEESLAVVSMLIFRSYTQSQSFQARIRTSRAAKKHHSQQSGHITQYDEALAFR